METDDLAEILDAIGPRVRKLRRDRRLTLKEVEAQTAYH
jgi:hypothetical protein